MPSPNKINHEAAARLIKQMQQRHADLGVVAFTSRGPGVQQAIAERALLRQWLAQYEQYAGVSEFSETT